MNIRHIFMTIAAIMLASAALADSSSVTSKKYVDDFMTGYQNKIPGSGTNKLMIYDSNESDGINQKAIVSSLGENTSATNVPNVGAVLDGLDGKQETFNGTAGYVMTGTGTAGNVGERAIYGTTTRYEDSLVTAESVNSGVINAVNNSLRRVNANGEPDDNGTLWQIADTVVALTFLPAGYTQLEYIASTSANQYITTGIQGAAGVSMKIVAQGTGDIGIISSFDQDWWGSYIKDTGSAWSDGTVFSTSSLNKTTIETSWATCTGDKLGQTTTINGETKTNCSYSRSPGNINIFRGSGWSAPGSYWIGKIYSVEIYNNGVLVRNFVPAKRNSDNAVGFYNLADTNPATAFYTNANTGGANFAAGPAVVQ